MNEYLFSIVVPVYKVEEYLPEIMKCLLNQTYRNIEIILVDDGSPDECGRLCDLYAVNDDRVISLHKDNGGLSSARNYGLDRCNGDYIVCIDSDDLVAFDYIEYFYEMICRYNADCVLCGCQNFIDGDEPCYLQGREAGVVLSKEQALTDWLYMRRIRTGVIGKCFAACLYDNIKYPEGKYYEDIYTIYRLFSKATKFVYGSSIKFSYRLRKNAQSKQPFSPKEMDSVEQTKILYDVIKRDYPKLEKAAACRYLSAVSHIFYMIKEKKDEQYEKIVWNEIKKVRKQVLCDKQARKKARSMALLSYSGMRITKKIGLLLRKD